MNLCCKTCISCSEHTWLAIVASSVAQLRHLFEWFIINGEFRRKLLAKYKNNAKITMYGDF